MVMTALASAQGMEPHEEGHCAAGEEAESAAEEDEAGEGGERAGGAGVVGAAEGWGASSMAVSVRSCVAARMGATLTCLTHSTI